MERKSKKQYISDPITDIIWLESFVLRKDRVDTAAIKAMDSKKEIYLLQEKAKEYGNA